MSMRSYEDQVWAEKQAERKAKLIIGCQVETPYGNGKIEHFTDYSVGRYYDVRLDGGELVKVFNTEIDAI